jgi:ribosomal protein S18 acetylase RimI-like enzyme
MTKRLGDSLSIQLLAPGGEDELDAFLAIHSHSSMYLRAALRRDADRPSFAVARQQGRIVAAASQAASGMILLQAPVGAGQLAAAVLRNSGRRLAGFFGPFAQIQAARRDMGLEDIPLLKSTHEDLFALEISNLRIPAILADQKATCRVAGEADFDHLVAWRARFRQATFGDVEGDYLDKTSRADIAALLPSGSLFILEEGNSALPVPLACCSFNARLPDGVQIGNVWTPPELRGKGYARAVVASALAMAGNTGVVEAILSTGRQNAAAQAAYRSLGFQLVGDYSIATISPTTALPDF